MNRIRITAALAVAAALGLALTACGGAETGNRSAAGTAPAATAPATAPGSAPATAPAPAAATTKLAAAQSPELGAIVTDSSGRTLYRFDEDDANPSVSNCAGDCAVKWPPALVGKNRNVTLVGVDQALVGTVQRADGSSQLTLNGWPLYQFAKDAKPGETFGQGVGGVWFAATPQGAKAGQADPGQPQDQQTQPSQPQEQQTEQPQGTGDDGYDDGYGY